MHDNDLALSIVIPVYNGGESFKNTVASILSQDLDPASFEVILVDDGSTDGSGAYCDELASTHAHFRTVHLPNSGSPARPRNTGVQEARGTYIFFVDADDLVAPGALSRMLSIAREKDLDVGVFKIDESEWDWSFGDLFDESQDNCTITNSKIMNTLGPCKLFKRSIIVDNDITFPENNVFEDLPFVLECYLHAERISIVADQVYYQYKYRTDGVSLSQIDYRTILDKRMRGIEHYLSVAARYETPRSLPHIFLRGFQYFDEMVSHILECKRTDLFKTARDVFAPYYCEEVRSLLPFTMMTHFDALMNEGPDTLTAIASKAVFLSFSKGETDETPRYHLSFAPEAAPRFSGVVPRDCGWGRRKLESPKVVTNVITKALLDERSIRFEGTLNVLREAAGGLRTVELKTNHLGVAHATARLVDATEERVFASVWHATCTWQAELPLAALPHPAEKDVAHFYLEIALEGAEPFDNRFGKRRISGVFPAFANAAILNEDCIFAPTETGYGNMSVNIVPATMAQASSGEVSLTKIGSKTSAAIKGALTFDNYPKTVIELVIRDASTNNIVAIDSMKKAKRRGDRTFEALVPLSLAKGMYELSLRATVPGGTIPLTCQMNETAAHTSGFGPFSRSFELSTLDDRTLTLHVS